MTLRALLRGWLLLAALALALLPITPPRAWADDEEEKLSKDPTPFNRLKYRNIGPYAGGRVCRSVGVPNNPLVYYTATASGGVWKSTDAGITWKPIFDDQPTATAGSIAVAPSDSNVVYVGSGEANIRGDVAEGNGIYRSTNGGKSWEHVWKQRGQVGHMIVHPKNPNVAFAAVLGRPFGPNPERGVYRTTNGGKNWKQVLSKDADTGAIDVCFDPTNPRILFAALWQARRYPWAFSSGGPGSGLYRSEDSGDTWKQLKGKGLPDGIWGRVGVAVAPSNGQRVYALIEADKGGLYRSDDGGDSWSLVNGEHALRVRPWYFSTVHVDPRNPDVVYCPNLGLLKSSDGGKKFKRVKGPHHGDHHDLWIDPTNPKRMIDSNDGGVDITTNGGATWFWPPMPISQFYHVNADNRTPYHIMGNMQDLGTAAGPSNSLNTAGIQLCDWYGVGGGETGFSVPDPDNPNVVYAGEYGGALTRFDLRTRQARNVSAYPYNGSGHGAEQLKVRFQWTAPAMISSHDKSVYHGANVLFRSSDGGKTWKAISPDLTRDDRSKQKFSGGPITGDNTGAEMYCTIFALAESPKQAGVLWAGSDDGLVHVSRDGGKSWDNVTKNIPKMPNWGTVACIEASPFDASTAYVVVDNHRMDDLTPYLYKTTDHGKTWQNLSGKMDRAVYLHAVREDPTSKGLLFVGTERGVLFSPDDGATWLPFKLNMPTVAVHDLHVKHNDLVVGTHGRSLWIFDNLTPVRQLRKLLTKPEKDYPEVIWFKDDLAAAIRWRYHAPIYSTEDRHAAPNPPKGAVLHYYLKKPAKELTLDVLDAKGQLVRQFTSKKSSPSEPTPAADLEPSEDDPDAGESYKPVKLSVKAGLHRVVWDLQYEGAKLIPGAKIDNGNPRVGPLANPGKYTLRLKVDGKEFPAATVEVLLDPRTKVSAKDFAEQLELALKVRDDISRVTALVKALRSVKKQIERRAALLRDEPKARSLLKQGKALVEKIDKLEEQLHNPRAKVAYDILAQKGGAKLYSQLANTLENLKDADGAPTQGVREVYADFARELRQLDAEVRKLFAGPLAELNDAARKGDLPTLVVPKLPPAP